MYTVKNSKPTLYVIKEPSMTGKNVVVKVYCDTLAIEVMVATPAKGKEASY